MHRQVVTAFLLTLLAVCGGATAQTPDWTLGGRAVYVAGSASTPPVGDTDARLELDGGGGLALDATLSLPYRLAVQVSVGGSYHSLEALRPGGCPGSCSYSLDGGHLWLLPVSAQLQYHHPVYGPWDPYVGLGVVWTSPVFNLSAELEAAGVERLDFDGGAGVTAQVGTNYALDEHWQVNLDLRYLGLSLEARARTTDGDLEPMTLDLDPWVLGLGFSYRF